MLLEGLAVIVITMGGIIFSRKRKKSLFRIDLHMVNGSKIPFSTQECKDIEFLQNELYDIGRDREKNYFFRDANITGISVFEVETNKEIFYVLLNK